MSETSLESLLQEFLPEQVAAQIEEQVATIEELPPVKALGALQAPVLGANPLELIKRRFLCRKGIGLLVGPTGVGKSSFFMQLAIHLAAGRSLFDIAPGDCYAESGMQVLLVQAENDDGDLAEMREGVLAGCTEMTGEEKERALTNIKVSTMCDRVGDRFAEALDMIIEQKGPFDLVIVDPAFAYLGGDSNSQREVSHFMRELLVPLVSRHDLGLILAHHTNKPLRGKERESWSAGDFAYLGAGSAEWINAARAALALRSVGSDSVYELRAVKRGQRLGWVDADGQPTRARYIAHHGDPGVICWRDATAEEVEEITATNAGKAGRKHKCDVTELIHCIAAKPDMNQAYYKQVISQHLECSPNAVQNAIKRAAHDGLVRYSEQGGQNLYHLTQKGDGRKSEKPSQHPWSELVSAHNS